jgi:hypothetical protein
MLSPTFDEYSKEEIIGCQYLYEDKSFYQEKHDRGKEPSMDIHKEISCPQLADVIEPDKGEEDQQLASTF